MSDWPTSGEPGRVLISPHSPLAMGTEYAALAAAAPASVAHGTANLARFYPFVLPDPILVVKLWWYNGATANGNAEAGIFAEDGTRLVSGGSVAQAGTNVLQEQDITDFWLGRGRYYLGLTSSSATATFFSNVLSISLSKMLGWAQQASFGPGWAANATLAAHAAAIEPVFGLSGRVLVL